MYNIHNDIIEICLGIVPLVTCKKYANIGEEIHINFLFDTSYYDVALCIDNNDMIYPNIDGIVIFSKPGIYKILVNGKPQHKKYNVIVN